MALPLRSRLLSCFVAALAVLTMLPADSAGAQTPDDEQLSNAELMARIASNPYQSRPIGELMARVVELPDDDAGNVLNRYIDYGEQNISDDGQRSSYLGNITKIFPPRLSYPALETVWGDGTGSDRTRIIEISRLTASIAYAPHYFDLTEEDKDFLVSLIGKLAPELKANEYWRPPSYIGGDIRLALQEIFGWIGDDSIPIILELFGSDGREISVLSYICSPKAIEILEEYLAEEVIDWKRIAALKGLGRCQEHITSAHLKRRMVDETLRYLESAEFRDHHELAEAAYWVGDPRFVPLLERIGSPIAESMAREIRKKTDPEFRERAWLEDDIESKRKFIQTLRVQISEGKDVEKNSRLLDRYEDDVEQLEQKLEALKNSEP